MIARRATAMPGARRGVRAGAPRGRGLRVALAVIAVAVVDHAFVSREPGTAAGDHLAGGLVPVLAAVALAWVYPRLRPGAQATTALSCGALALTAAAARLPGSPRSPAASPAPEPWSPSARARCGAAAGRAGASDRGGARVGARSRAYFVRWRRDRVSPSSPPSAAGPSPRAPILGRPYETVHAHHGGRPEARGPGTSRAATARR